MVEVGWNGIGWDRMGWDGWMDGWMDEQVGKQASTWIEIKGKEG